MSYLKTHCVHGHAYTVENTIHTKAGKRRCRVCVEAQTRERAERLRASRPARQPPLPATRCGNGHEYTPDNTWISSTGRRSCRRCNADGARRFYNRHPEVAARRARAHAHHNRAIVLIAKGNVCSDCGGEFMSRELHFHHVDPSTKLSTVGNLTARHSEQAVREEIAKCAVLCAGCHERVHEDDVGVVGGCGR